ncbi:MAG: LysM peptidoglycan-binding domain-containing protein [Anaerovoracaceae bacterium]
MKTSLVCIDVYTVSEGDTLYSIAEKYDLPVSLLMKVNCIDNPYNLQIGTRLCIPGTEDQLPQTPENCNTTHVVAPGDTLYLIAKTRHKARQPHAGKPQHRSVQYADRNRTVHTERKIAKNI